MVQVSPYVQSYAGECYTPALPECYHFPLPEHSANTYGASITVRGTVTQGKWYGDVKGTWYGDVGHLVW